ncbi:unnamed protein product [Haemonchus placei]|uniref:Cytochrome P450 n=1 Tax=Haemonchus placei TaxID=6290 RepID=A0A0N4WTG7_HAEPC|nr:unnamed protein product [Haemonchus placei]
MIFLGNMYELTDVSKPVGLVLREWTKTYGKVYGIQEGLRRTIVISDVEMIRELFIKKFDYFYGRKSNIIGGDVEKDSRVHVFEAQGVRWKRLRAISSPAFSSGSLKKEFTMDVISRIAMGQQGSQMFKDKRKVATMDSVTKHLTREEIAAQCFVFLLAGFDTTATSLAFVTYLLAKNPRVQQILQEEIDQHCNSDSETINYETLSSMKYLDSVMKESLRIYPLAVIANSRRCMKSTTLGPIRVEEGEFVIADTMSLHFDRDLWGDDAEEFRPERLLLVLESLPKQKFWYLIQYLRRGIANHHKRQEFDKRLFRWTESTERSSAAFLSFGLGPRQCIGMRLAHMEEKLVLAHLLRRYDIIATNDTEVILLFVLLRFSVVVFAGYKSSSISLATSVLN